MWVSVLPVIIRAVFAFCFSKLTVPLLSFLFHLSSIPGLQLPPLLSANDASGCVSGCLGNPNMGLSVPDESTKGYLPEIKCLCGIRFSCFMEVRGSENKKETNYMWALQYLSTIELQSHETSILGCHSSKLRSTVVN
ncbi:hypothetical protein DFP73DRAFT_70236 [Morchella snyderi]|nr:hypothetical protein DFP73DRAFT_70236 [Morchella snyderi]